MDKFISNYYIFSMHVDFNINDAYIVPLDSGIYLIHKQSTSSEKNEELHTIYEINKSGELTYVAEFNENSDEEMFLVNDKFAKSIENGEILNMMIQMIN